MRCELNEKKEENNGERIMEKGIKVRKGVSEVENWKKNDRNMYKDMEGKKNKTTELCFHSQK